MSGSLVRQSALVAICASLIGCGMSDPQTEAPSPTVPLVASGPRQDPVTSLTSVTGNFDQARADDLSQALEDAVASSSTPGAQAAVVLSDGSMWTAAAGLSAVGQPLDTDHLMAIASVTKLYTAALILLLAEDGLVSLDDRIGRWVHGIPRADEITVRQLLTHTSGLASDDEELAPVCDPGECYSYSNAAIGLLGQIIEVADGRSYADSLRARILEPLGLAATFYPAEEQVRGVAALGYQGGEAVDAVAAASVGETDGYRRASGGVLATAADTARFMSGLFGGRILPDSTIAEMVDVKATHGLPGTNECEIGAGIVVGLRATPSGASWVHGGFAGYFRSWAEYLPGSGATLVVVVNSDAPIEPLVGALRAAAVGEAADDGDARRGSCNVDIGLLRPDGTTALITTDQGFDGMPSVAADGRIAWISGRSGFNDVFIASSDGSGAVNLTANEAQDLFPRWSPDGSTIAYSSNIDGDHEIYLVAPDGTNRRQVTNNDWDDMLPAWAPTGLRIAFTSMRHGREIHAINVDGTGDSLLTTGSVGGWWPAWSPDGARIAYEAGGILYVMPSEGGDSFRVPIQQIRVTMFPAWAPGGYILFSSDFDIYSVAADGTGLTRITSTSAAEELPAWGVNGTMAYQISHWVEDP